jgi:hypothetical protein
LNYYFIVLVLGIIIEREFQPLKIDLEPADLHMIVEVEAESAWSDSVSFSGS